MQIADYMKNIRKELKNLKKDTPYLEEIICNCDMVIMTAKFVERKLTGKKDRKLKKEISKLKAEFLRLWEKENRIKGSEIFADTLDKMMKLI